MAGNCEEKNGFGGAGKVVFFSSMKGFGVLPLTLDGMLVHHRRSDPWERDCRVCRCKSHLVLNRFRTDWPVERVGKWRELDYTAPVYPSFACGAGNVLSADLVRWLALNAAHLKPYQVH